MIGKAAPGGHQRHELGVDPLRSRHGARLVLLAIADCASGDGANAWPSVAELKRKAGLAERAVQTALAELVKLGELEIDYNAGPKGCNRYRVLMTVHTPAETAPPQILHPPADIAPPQDLRGNASVQANGQNPADIAPPAESAPPQISTLTPAESAPGTVRHVRDLLLRASAILSRSAKTWTGSALTSLSAWSPTCCKPPTITQTPGAGKPACSSTRTGAPRSRFTRDRLVPGQAASGAARSCRWPSSATSTTSCASRPSPSGTRPTATAGAPRLLPRRCRRPARQRGLRTRRNQAMTPDEINAEAAAIWLADRRDRLVANLLANRPAEIAAPGELDPRIADWAARLAAGDKQNLILAGPVGTGKTWAVWKAAEQAVRGGYDGLAVITTAAPLPPRHRPRHRGARRVRAATSPRGCWQSTTSPRCGCPSGTWTTSASSSTPGGARSSRPWSRPTRPTWHPCSARGSPAASPTTPSSSRWTGRTAGGSRDRVRPRPRPGPRAGPHR